MWYLLIKYDIMYSVCTCRGLCYVSHTQNSIPEGILGCWFIGNTNLPRIIHLCRARMVHRDSKRGRERTKHSSMLIWHRSKPVVCQQEMFASNHEKTHTCRAGVEDAAQRMGGIGVDLWSVNNFYFHLLAMNLLICFSFSLFIFRWLAENNNLLWTKSIYIVLQ